MSEIQDFGEKIGGARKDVWRSRGIILTDLDHMNDLERSTNIKKDNIWLKPDWEEIIADGIPQCVAYWQNKMRQAIPPKPASGDKTVQQNYVEVVGRIREAVMAVTQPHEIDNFYQDFLLGKYVHSEGRYSHYVTVDPIASGIVNNKVLKAAQSKHTRMEEEAKKKLFGVPKDELVYVATKERLKIHQYDGKSVSLESAEGTSNKATLTISSPWGRSFFYLSEKDSFSDISKWQQGTFFILDEKSRKPIQINLPSMNEAKRFVEAWAQAAQMAADIEGTDKGKSSGPKRKGAFVPPQLRNIHRTGPDYCHGHHANSDMFLKDIQFRGGEFGNWLNEADRQTSLDMAYDALRDLARLLEVRPQGISFDKSLAIAFGARGRGGANAGAAHYEPDREVINLTKMSGAGCLAHEWGHALDHAIGKASGILGLASDQKSKRGLPESFRELLDALRYKTATIPSEEVSNEYLDKIKHARKNLTNWIDSQKPLYLSESSQKYWDSAKQSILDNASSFTGSEYFPLRRGDAVQTKPEIEILSQICKASQNRGIARNAKQQMVLWAVEVARCEKEAKDRGPVERMVKTEFYKGSMEFDKIYSRAGHGYWQSECEMFARAFDCYIADKIKSSGYQSDYLSARADAFVMTVKDGQMIAAVPQGEERALINAKFDVLLEDLKERGILQHHVEEMERSEPEQKRTELRSKNLSVESDKHTHYEQMSFEEMLFSAQSRASQSKEGKYNKELSR